MRHCERSEAIQHPSTAHFWIASGCAFAMTAPVIYACLFLKISKLAMTGTY
jgi:hypothetical protein